MNRPPDNPSATSRGRGAREGVGAREPHRTHPHADRSDRHEPEFHFVAGKPACRDAADRDPHRQERLQDADPALVELQHFHAEQDDDHL